MVDYKYSIYYYVLFIAYILFYQEYIINIFIEITPALKEVAIYMRRKKHRPPKKGILYVIVQERTL